MRNSILRRLVLLLVKIVCLLIAIAYFTIAERKIRAAIQRRRGPNVVGVYGLLQPLADGLKLIAKERIIPTQANSSIFVFAPRVVLTVGLLNWSVIPFGTYDYTEYRTQSNRAKTLTQDYSPRGILGLGCITTLYKKWKESHVLVWICKAANSDAVRKNILRALKTVSPLPHDFITRVVPQTINRIADNANYPEDSPQYILLEFLKKYAVARCAVIIVAFILSLLIILYQEQIIWQSEQQVGAGRQVTKASYKRKVRKSPKRLFVKRKMKKAKRNNWIAMKVPGAKNRLLQKPPADNSKPPSIEQNNFLFFLRAAVGSKEFQYLTERDNISNVRYSLLVILALSSLTVYGIIVAGWASNSKYAFIGALRSAAQRISYEVSISLVILPIILLGGSLNFTEIVRGQEISVSNFRPLFPGSGRYLVSRIAETNRTPFDLPEAEAELVAGYNVDYSSIIFARFFLAEYGNRIRRSTQKSRLFFGALGIKSFKAIFGRELAAVLLTIKTLVFCFIFVLVRATFPRYRYDQLRDIGWKVFLPVATGFLIFTLGTLRAINIIPVTTEISLVEYAESASNGESKSSYWIKKFFWAIGSSVAFSLLGYVVNKYWIVPSSLRRGNQLRRNAPITPKQFYKYTNYSSDLFDYHSMQSPEKKRFFDRENSRRRRSNVFDLAEELYQREPNEVNHRALVAAEAKLNSILDKRDQLYHSRPKHVQAKIHHLRRRRTDDEQKLLLLELAADEINKKKPGGGSNPPSNPGLSNPSQSSSSSSKFTTLLTVFISFARAFLLCAPLVL